MASDAERSLFSKQLTIQGMRGIGTVGVIVYHMTGRLSSAAAAFDVFFVASGYLITLRLLVLAEAGSARAYFLRFYAFRARRILPAAIVTLVVTCLIAYAVYLPARAHTVTVDSVWALLFLANVHFAASGTNYFAQALSASPVQHYWSLSVEEQFYLVWPVVLIVTLAIAARRHSIRSRVAGVALVVAVLSFGYAWWAAETHPVTAYFSTVARAWDFAVGALLADFALRRAHSTSPSPTGYATVVSWAGFAIFLASLFLTPSTSGYPGPWAAFAVSGAVLMFYANIVRTTTSWVLTNRLIVWLGDISYSLYLVHFPVIVFARSYLGGSTALLYGFDVVATLGAALLLFHFVEEPGRRGVARTRAWLRQGGHRSVLARIIACAAVATFLFAVAPRSGVEADQHVVAPPPGSGGGAPPATPPAPGSYDASDAVQPTAAVAAALADAVRLTSWPHLANESRIGHPEGFIDTCNVVSTLQPPCVARPSTGTDPAKVAVAFGDSTMLSDWPMLRDALVPQGWTVVMFGLTGCPAAMVDALGGGSRDFADCDRHHAAYQQVLDTWKPSLVLLANAEQSSGTVVDGQGTVLSGKESTAAYEKGLKRVIAMASAASARVAVISPPPVGYDLGACDVAGSAPSSCLHAPLDTWFELSAADRHVATQTGASYADLLPFYCHELQCPAVVGDLAVRADQVHVTPEYADLLAPSFGQYLAESGLLR